MLPIKFDWRHVMLAASGGDVGVPLFRERLGAEQAPRPLPLALHEVGHRDVERHVLENVRRHGAQPGFVLNGFFAAREHPRRGHDGAENGVAINDGHDGDGGPVVA